MFSKRFLSEHSLVAFFSGVRKRKIFREVPCQANEEAWSDYSITMSKDLSLDIPDSFINASNYCATLGHKACHSFEPNCRFGKCFHPRFGLIMALFAIRDIEPGEELLVNYRYPIRTAPAWYKSLWHRFLRSKKRWSLDNIMYYGYEAHDVHSRFLALDAIFSRQMQVASF